MADGLTHPMAAIYQQPIPADGPNNQPDGPRSFTTYLPPMSFAPGPSLPDGHSEPIMISEPKFYPASSNDLYNHVQNQSGSSSPTPDPTASQGGAGANHYPSANGVPRLPPILQVEKQQVTTSATQLASASRRRNEANFACPVPGCGSTFTRRFNLRGVCTPLILPSTSLLTRIQAIFDLTLKSARTFVNGQDVKRGSPANMTASMWPVASGSSFACLISLPDVTKPSMLPNRRLTFAAGVRKRSADWMLLM